MKVASPGISSASPDRRRRQEEIDEEAKGASVSEQ